MNGLRKRSAAWMPLWLIPMVYVGATVVSGLVLPRLEFAYLSAFQHDVSVQSALAALSAIASGMLALTGIVYALALVMVQFNAMAYSPRLVSWFSSDPLLFHALGLFMATFGYAIAAISWIDRTGSGRVPLFSVMAVIVLLVLSMIAFARLVQRLNELQIGSVLETIGHRGREVIRDMFPEFDAAAAAQRPAWSDVRRDARRRPLLQALAHSGAPRAVGRFDLDALVRLASDAEAVIVLDCAVGDTLVEGAPVLRVHGGGRPIDDAALRRAVHLARERTFEQDPKYPLRLLVDIAIKALSPAINDPTTAVQAIDQIEDLLRRLGQRVLDSGLAVDTRGAVRVVFPTPTWDDYLGLAFDEIRQFGAGSVQVMRRLRSALIGIGESAAEPGRRSAVERYLRHLDMVVAGSALDAQDKVVARQEDRQGLGLSRAHTEPET